MTGHPQAQNQSAPSREFGPSVKPFNFIILHIGFNAGWIKWDDQNIRNDNSIKGQMPDGWYDKNTKIDYCCRQDGHATNAIILPTESPFVLLKSNTHLCQHVRGMKVRSEFFHWDCEDWFPGNKAGGSRPYASIGKNIKLDYCYYYH